MSIQRTPPPDGARRVPCPTCGQPSRFAPENPWRPFCSERCRSVDFGAWASERYRVAAPPGPDDAPDDTPDGSAH